MAWDDLPEGWEIRRLGEVTRIGVPKGWKPTPHDGKIPFIRMADIDQETGLHSRYIWKDFSEVSGGKVRFAADAILVAKITPCTENNKTALVPEIPTNGGYATTEVFAVHPSMWTDRLYLLYFLRSPQVREVLVRSMTGSTGRQRVPKQALEGLEIPLPPLLEQRRIVARIEELTERIDAARRLRAEAVEEADAIVRTAALEAFRELDCEEVPLGEVTESSRYGTSKRASSEPIGYPMLRMNNVTLDGKLDLADLKYVQLDEREFAKLRLHPGDIVVNRTNSKELVGKCAVFHIQDADYVFASYLIRFRLNGSEADPDYVVYYLSSPLGREQIDARSHGATNQFNINSAELKSIPIPLPPLDEQRRIVEYLDAVQAKAEAIRRYQEETQQEIEAMTGAVLERAFRGEL